MLLMSVLFWRCEEVKWKPHVELSERVSHCWPKLNKISSEVQLLVLYRIPQDIGDFQQ